MVCLALARLSPQEGVGASTITVGLQSQYWPLYSLAVNAGDTVTWVNWQQSWLGTNYVESYGGEWKSPPMNLGDSFSFTFTNPGFYAYRTGTVGAPGTLLPGTVTVSAWTNAPPAVTLNSAVAGSIVSFAEGGWVQASVTNADGPAEMQYFANSSLIAIATTPPLRDRMGAFSPRGPGPVLHRGQGDQPAGCSRLVAACRRHSRPGNRRMGRQAVAHGGNAVFL